MCGCPLGTSVLLVMLSGYKTFGNCHNWQPLTKPTCRGGVGSDKRANPRLVGVEALHLFELVEGFCPKSFSYTTPS